MLVLSRKKKQSIILNDNIEITVIEVLEDQVKLGISAPKEVSVHRSEIYEKIKQEMQIAAKSYPDTLKTLTPKAKPSSKSIPPSPKKPTQPQ